MRTCKDCLAYKIHHNLSEPDICPECHEKTLHWKQNEFGTFSLACSNCSETIAVDLNTPCEEATVFHQTHSDANEAYISLEQSEEGDWISLCGIPIYRYRNIDRYGYTWTHENQVLVFVTNEPPEAAEAFLEEFIEQRDAASAK